MKTTDDTEIALKLSYVVLMNTCFVKTQNVCLKKPADRLPEQCTSLFVEHRVRTPASLTFTYPQETRGTKGQDSGFLAWKLEELVGYTSANTFFSRVNHAVTLG